MPYHSDPAAAGEESRSENDTPDLLRPYIAFWVEKDGRGTHPRQRHYEIFRGDTSDDSADWRRHPITANSSVNNLRPLVPKWKAPRTGLVWMRGPSCTNNQGNWTTAVVALLLPATSRS